MALRHINKSAPKSLNWQETLYTIRMSFWKEYPGSDSNALKDPGVWRLKSIFKGKKKKKEEMWLLEKEADVLTRKEKKKKSQITNTWALQQF